MPNWQPLLINSKRYIFKIEENNDDSSDPSFTCLFSDFTSLWHETLCKSELSARAQDANPHKDADLELFPTLNDPPQPAGGRDKIDIHEINATSIELQLKYYNSGSIPFKFYWKLTHSSPQMLCEKLTVPLFQHIAKLEHETVQLRKVIENKEMEIKQFEVEGRGPLERFTVVTGVFDQATDRTELLLGCSLASLNWWPVAGVESHSPMARKMDSKMPATDRGPSTMGKKAPVSSRLMRGLLQKQEKVSYHPADSQESDVPLQAGDGEKSAENDSKNGCPSQLSETVELPRKIPRLNL